MWASLEAAEWGKGEHPGENRGESQVRSPQKTEGQGMCSK